MRILIITCALGLAACASKPATPEPACHAGDVAHKLIATVLYNPFALTDCIPSSSAPEK